MLAMADQYHSARAGGSTGAFSSWRTVTVSLIVSVFPLLVPAPALPQEKRVREAALEEVVVTARRREEAMQTTPLSITAITSADIDARALADIAEIAAFTPNLEIGLGARGTPSASSAAYVIRGIGQLDNTLTTEPGVGIYLDGVYVARSVGSLLNLVDVEQIEVLRGPQGTLFGRNSTGGAINITSRRPGDEFSGYAELVAGRFNRLDGKVAFDVPFSERFRGRLSLASYNQDGYVERPLAGDQLAGSETTAWRANFLYTPSDRLDFNLSLDGSSTRGDSSALTVVAIGDGVGGNPFSPFIAIFENPRRVANGEPRYTSQLWMTDDIDVNLGTYPAIDETDVLGGSLTISWSFNDRVQLKSITAHRDLDAFYTSDQDASPLTLVHTEDVYKQQQFSQELQLSGSSGDARSNWLLGLYYFNEDGRNANSLQFMKGFGDFFGLGLSDESFDFLSGGTVENASKAAFAHLSLGITDAFSLSAGVRYTRDEKAFRPDSYVREARRNGVSVVVSSGGLVPDGIPFLLDPLLPMEGAARVDDELTPKLSLEYLLNENLFLYGSYSAGFKGGGFGQRIIPGRSDVPDFGPEEVDVYEVGFKWDALNKRVRLNGAGFYMDYSDIQINFFDGVGTRPQNAGEAEFKGVELELIARPLPRVEFYGAVGYLDAKLTKLDPNAINVTLETRFPYVSEWTAAMGASYRHDLGSIGDFALRLDWSYRSEYSPDAENHPLLVQESFDLFNIVGNVTVADGRVSIVGGVKNLTDERYVTGGLADLEGLGQAQISYSRPREWFVSCQYRF
jgi:iron complex outermembrane receptor protein